MNALAHGILVRRPPPQLLSFTVLGTWCGSSTVTKYMQVGTYWMHTTASESQPTHLRSLLLSSDDPEPETCDLPHQTDLQDVERLIGELVSEVWRERPGERYPSGPGWQGGLILEEAIVEGRGKYSVTSTSMRQCFAALFKECNLQPALPQQSTTLPSSMQVHVVHANCGRRPLFCESRR